MFSLLLKDLISDFYSIALKGVFFFFNSLPWVTPEIKCLIRNRDKSYVPYKKSGDLDKKNSFKSICQQIKRKIKDYYHTYLESLLGIGDGEVCDSKKLFSFLKNSRQDQQGTPLLKDDQDHHWHGRQSKCIQLAVLVCVHT